MANLVPTTDGFSVQLSTLERLGALGGDVAVTSNQIASVRRVDRAREHVRGFRAPGTAWPGTIALGTWRRPGHTSFVAAYHRDPGYVIDLTRHRLDRIIVSSDPVEFLDAFAARRPI